VPAFIVSENIFLRDSIFKNSLPIETGFHIYYSSEYIPYAYNPEISSFYLQANPKVGGYPLIDFFLEFKVKNRAKISFRVDHLNEGFTGSNYYSIPGYLIPGRTFRLSINWRFFD
jgi:outer membrane cobalamin receptor